jgi:hypothetical protein
MIFEPNRTYNRLGKRQRALITDMFENGLAISQALEKNKIPKWLFRKWKANPFFMEQCREQVNEATQQNTILLARVFPQAAKRLAELLVSEKDEIVRKVCVNLIEMRKADIEHDLARKEDDDQTKNKYNLTQEKAAKIWAVLAEKDPPKTPAKS